MTDGRALSEALNAWMNAAAARPAELPPSRLVCAPATGDGESVPDDQDGFGCPCCRLR